MGHTHTIIGQTVTAWRKLVLLASNFYEEFSQQ